jgi:hypothetical protein
VKLSLNVGLVELDVFLFSVGGSFKVENEYIPNIIKHFITIMFFVLI